MSIQQVFHKTFSAMGTRMDLVIVNISDYTGKMLFDLIRAETLRLEEKISAFKSTSAISILNQQAAKTKVQTDIEIIEILEQCQFFHEKTLNYFDISKGKIYRKLKEDGLDPIDNKKHSSSEDIRINKVNLSVNYASDNINIDLGAIGKGLALKKITQIIEKFEIKSGLISFGESSFMAIGQHPQGEYWPIGIADLFSDKKNACTVHLKNNFLSISGLQRKISTQQKKSVWHIYNPKTEEAEKGNKMVAVVSDDPVIAEVLSTSLLLCKNQEEKQDILNNFSNAKPEITEIIYEKYYPVVKKYAYQKE